jgi:membrane protease YdiL (CAAX protease family)
LESQSDDRQRRRFRLCEHPWLFLVAKERIEMGITTRVADRRPFVFTLLVVLAWFLVGGGIAAATASVLQTPMVDTWPQTVGSLAATGVLLLVVSRLGWLRPMGITTLGSWSTWAVTLLLGSYLVLSGSFAFFGEVAFDPRSLLGMEEAGAILLRQATVGFVEETLFRGVLLYALSRAWGRTKQGLVAAVVVQAALFGVPHALQAFVGAAPVTALINVVATFVTGLWLGLLVLGVGTLWPAVLLHTVSNAAILIKGLASPWLDPALLGYVRATLFELILVLVGLWIVLKLQPTPVQSARTLSGAIERGGI